MAQVLSTKRKEILDCIAEAGPRAGLPPVGPRDRRGRRAHLLLDRPRPPGRPPARGLPAARPDQAAGHRGLLRPGLQGHRGVAARSATCRWWATWPPAPACWPRRTSRSSSPCPRTSPGRGPFHAQGPRRLDDRCRHLRRRLRRGPPAARRRARRRRGGRHPRRRGHGQDLLAPRRADRAHPGQRAPLADGPRPRPTCRSTARWSPSSAGSDRRTVDRVPARSARPGQRARPAPSCAPTSSSAVTNSSGVWASRGSPGPKLVAGIPCDGEGRDVGPSELGPCRRARSHRPARPARGRRAWAGPRRRRRPAPSGHPPRGEGPSSCAQRSLGLLDGAVGGEAVVEDEGGRVGDDVGGHSTVDAGPPAAARRTRSRR